MDPNWPEPEPYDRDPNFGNFAGAWVRKIMGKYDYKWGDVLNPHRFVNRAL